jgi:hypothetical protein
MNAAHCTDARAFVAGLAVSLFSGLAFGADGGNAALTSAGKEIVFAARPVVAEHWYANFGYYAASSKNPYFATDKLYRNGAKLYRLSLANNRLTTLLDDPQGGIRDLQVHYDGRKTITCTRSSATAAVCGSSPTGRLTTSSRLTCRMEGSSSSPAGRGDG